LRRAQIRVSATEQRINRGVNTDADGRYELTELPAGRYNIFVTRNGYVPLQFGQRRPFETGRPLDLADGQDAEKIDFALPRGAVIAGRVTDELGEPLAGVRMSAMRYQYLPNGQRRLTPIGGGGLFGGIATNDLGEFRLYSLMPGTYVVSAMPAESGGMMMTTPGGPAAQGAQQDGHGLTYFPGTTNEDEAQAITVGLSDVANASFAMVPQRTTQVSGIVRDSQGKPLSTSLSLRTQSGNGMSMRMLTSSGSDGRFSVGNIPPGEHYIEVASRPGNEESASVKIQSDGQEISDLIIATAPGATILGHVTYEGAAARPKLLRVGVSSPDPGMPPPARFFDDTQGVVDDQGQFHIRGVHGRVTFNAGFGTPGAPGWFLKSVMFNGENITDLPFDPSTARGDARVEIVMTDKQTTLSGRVRDVRGQPVTDYTVAIFPARLRDGALPARYTRVVRPDQQGRFETRGLPPGEYVGVAVESLEQGGQWDPAFRSQIEPGSKRFTLAEGQTATVDLPLVE
jgi:protocatechuate 3,4-dioxygenase beta subunit